MFIGEHDPGTDPPPLRWSLAWLSPDGQVHGCSHRVLQAAWRRRRGWVPAGRRQPCGRPRPGDRNGADPIEGKPRPSKARESKGGPYGTLVTSGGSPKAGPGPALQPESINTLVQKAVAPAGLDPRPYGAHGLRAGFVTYAPHPRGASGRTRASLGYPEPPSRPSLHLRSCGAPH